MSASCSSTPASSKIPPEDGDLLGEIRQALLGFGDEHRGFLSAVGGRDAKGRAGGTRIPTRRRPGN
jgi:hypothetical protein